MDNNLKDLVVEPLEMNKNTNEKIDLQKNELKVIPLQNAPVQAPQVENKKTAVKEKKKKLRDMWEKVESNMPSYLEEGDRLNKTWVGIKIDKLVQADEQKKESAFNELHNTENHSKRFKEVVNKERLETGDIRDMDIITNLPGEAVLGNEYKAKFSVRLDDEVRAKKIKNKRSRLFVKNENANLVETAEKEFQTNSFKLINRAITKQAQRCNEEDYHDLAMFMKEGKDKENIQLVNLYLGKSVKTGPGGFEGQDVQLALDHMAGQLFSIHISDLKFENDAEMAKNAPMFEKLAGQVAAFDRLAAKHNFMERLDKKQKDRLNERLESLRSIAAYYSVRKDLICDKYYKTHYNDELSLDVAGATNDEQRAVGEKLVKSLILGRNMLGLNGVNIYLPQFKGNIRYTDEKSLDIIKQLNAEYSKKGICSEMTSNAHKQKDVTALNELMKCKTKLEALNKQMPLEEQENIQKTMNAVMDKAFEPVQKPEERCSTYVKIKNRLMLGYRFLLRSTVGVVSSLLLNLVTGTEAALFEHGRRKKGQKKRDHLSVPGRKDEFFEEEIVRKNDEGEDLDVYSDVRRGPLVWEKLSAGDPEDPPEVSILIEQSKRGSGSALATMEMGHAMIGLSYSRYCKATKRKERYKVKFGFYPGGGLIPGSALSLIGGGTTAGRLDEDNSNDYDVARRYQVKPGDINKILRAAETYADKGYGYYKRNCSTFVADMAKLINLPVANELQEDEMNFEGAKDLAVQTLDAGKDSGIFMGANAISSRMVKADLSYLNFGQNRCTEEDLDNYYKSLGKGDLIKKGYTPGGMGETLRYSKNGELFAQYTEDRKMKIDNIGAEIGDVGSQIWNLIDPEQLGPQTAEDMEALGYLIGVSDSGLNTMYNNVDKTTPDMVRLAHKNIRNAMKGLNKYYKERLGGDPKYNALFMKLFSLFECTLIFADRLYSRILDKEVKGDAGILRYEFNHNQEMGYFIEEDGSKKAVMMKTGVYEGLLLAHKTPEEAIKLLHRQQELNDIDSKKRTKEQKAELEKIGYITTLAKDFANANRYLLEKDDFSEKDIKYAFHELPNMEVPADKAYNFGGEFFEHHRPSYAYQSVIWEKIFGGFRKLKLEQYKSPEEQRKALDDYFVEGFNNNLEMVRMILKWFLEGNDKNKNRGKKMEVQVLTGEFMAGLEESCLRPAYHNVPAFSGAYLTGITATMYAKSKTYDFLVKEMSKIKYPEGVE